MQHFKIILSHLPVQLKPSPVYSSKQAHSTLPFVLEQLANSEHGFEISHKDNSTKINTKETKIQQKWTLLLNLSSFFESFPNVCDYCVKSINRYPN